MSAGDPLGRRRKEYERFFLAELRKLLDPDGPVEGRSKDEGYAEMKRGEACIWQGIGAEEIYLDTSAPWHEAVVLGRDLSRLECLFGWPRAPARWSPRPAWRKT
ncbi:hypothetical protein GBA65_12910 [Rubrobacter marinus]|uniref:Uncharacterized protein n=1 Tax=Rubrobacter marinus TaxID=2653852 RepID=A0A6G8PYH5_9ACTN|nr:hypothetical protein [Rubrobacter marinus]QIN79269.1 hypothetical protein GBA65_12910 [Rubrobacter marinus]